ASRLTPLFTFFSSLLPRPPLSTLFPYTTLFRSFPATHGRTSRPCIRRKPSILAAPTATVEILRSPFDREPHRIPRNTLRQKKKRSEEHTSELQSLRHLVCRLLLEKKKKNKQKTN